MMCLLVNKTLRAVFQNRCLKRENFVKPRCTGAADCTSELNTLCNQLTEWDSYGRMCGQTILRSLVHCLVHSLEQGSVVNI